jgi:hypothetical protein
VLGLGLLGLGDQDLEHAVLERGLDPLRHHLGGQGDRAAEGAVAALDPVVLLLGGLAGELALALDDQQAILHRDAGLVHIAPCSSAPTWLPSLVDKQVAIGRLRSVG